MRDEPHDPLDAVIDRASRALISSEPGPSFGVGVRDRIHSRPRWPALPVWGAAAAALALVALVPALTGGPDAPASGERVTPDAAVSRPAPAAVSAGVSGDGGEARVAAAGPVRRAAPPEAPTLEMEPLIPPIAIAPLGTDQIAVSDVNAGAMPIEITPLEIELIDVTQLPTTSVQFPAESKGA